MKKLPLRLALGLALWLGLTAPTFAVLIPTNVGNAAYTILRTDTNIITTTAFTASRTWTLPAANQTCIGQTCKPAADQLQIIDQAGAITATNTLVIAPATGDTINGNAANLILSAAGVRVVLIPTSPNNWTAFVAGDLVTSGTCAGSALTATITATIAAPGVVTWTAHGLTGACPVVFTTSDTLPTGITSGTTYYVVPSSVTANTFTIATTVANALAGTQITTSGTQAGTHTGTAGVALTSTTAATITGLSLSQGDWNCFGVGSRVLASNTSVTVLRTSISTAATTSGTQGTTGSSFLQTAANVMGVLGQDTVVGPVRVSLAATTNYFLVAQDTFSVSTDVGFGTMTCRRDR